MTRWTRRRIPSAAAGLTMLVLLGTMVAPGAARARSCAIGNSGVTYNQLGERAVFESLHVIRRMNCSSARYVLNKWLRRHYARSYSHSLPLRFWDGYVTWHCHRSSRLRWRCDEYDSYSSFGFIAYRG
jgi:hypothetical protein